MQKVQQCVNSIHVCMLTVRVTIRFLTLNITCFFVFGAFKVLSTSYLEIQRTGVMALEGNPSTREAGAQCRHSELEQSELQSETHIAVESPEEENHSQLRFALQPHRTF